MKHVAIVGGGITGLFLAYTLSKHEEYTVTLIEKSPFVGGAATSFQYKDFMLDYGPHKIYTQLSGILSEYKKLLGNDLLKVKKRNSIRLLGKYFSFPVKMAQLALGIKPTMAAKMGVGFGMTAIKTPFAKKPESYEDYFLQGFGQQGYDILFRDMAWKVWGNPKKLSAELAKKRVPVSNVFDLVKTMLVKPDKSTSAEYFYYPRLGMKQFIDRIEEEARNQGVTIHTNATVKSLVRQGESIKELTLLTAEGESTLPVDYTISTVGLNQLIPLMKPAAPKQLVASSSKLTYRGIIIVYLFVQKDQVLNDNWIFFPERAFIFNRVAELKSFSKGIGPRGKTVLTAEITADPDDAIYKQSDEVIVQKVIKDMVKAGLLKKHLIYDTLVKRAKNLYPVYLIGYRDHVDTVLDYVDTFDNLLTIGRQGFFNYNNTDHDIDMAKRTTDFLVKQKPKKEWKKLRKIFDSYQIVD